MVTVVDIYIKLIIAVLGFVAPTVTLLFPVFFKGITIIKDKLVIQENQFEELIKRELETIDSSLAKVETLGVDAAKIKEDFKRDRINKQHQATNKLRRNLYYFELKEQIKWIFVPLFLSLVYVMIYAIIKDDVFKMLNANDVKCVGAFIILIHAVTFFLTAFGIIIRIYVPKFNKNLTDWAIRNNEKWLYLTFGLLLVSVLVYFCVENNWFNAEDEFIKIHIESYILFISLLLFFSTIRRLWGIVCTVIEAKPMLEENVQDNRPMQVPQVPQPTQVPQPPPPSQVPPPPPPSDASL